MSSTATRTPAPVWPAAHAAGAPTWAVERSRRTRRTPSSQTFRTPGSVSSPWNAETAPVFGVPVFGVPVFGTAVAVKSSPRATMSGTLSRRASS
ncbi:hypothetical protein [Saccharothrix lopnurensis]|uniref:Amidase domain-containing protein n=1 Tax=Saccharothrix lopnurensis TaxID=1670621 RepID=A0ABW1NXV5_9PSEU